MNRLECGQNSIKMIYEVLQGGCLTTVPRHDLSTVHSRCVCCSLFSLASCGNMETEWTQLISALSHSIVRVNKFNKLR
jgi:hypothetical protein